MDPALIKLLRLRLRGGLRRSFRGIKTVRGAVFFLFGLGTLLMWIGPQFVVLFFAKHARNDPEILRDILPLGLLGLMLTSMLTATRVEGIHFTAAEVDFLFSGPFTRRHLLLYKLSSGMASSLFVALILSITLLRYASLWTAAFMGSFLTMVFVHLLITALVLAGQTMAQQMYTHARKAVLLVIIGLAVVVAANWLPIFFERGFQEAAHRLRCSSLGFWLFMPLEPFVRTIIAVKIPDLIGWAAAAAAIDLALLALVVRIDVNYMESSLVASQKRYLMLQRRRTGRLIVKPHVGWRVPQLPWLSGAGPIAWRQLTTALRSVHGLLPLFLIIVGIAVAPLLLQAQRASMGVGLFVGQICFLTMLMTRMVANRDYAGTTGYSRAPDDGNTCHVACGRCAFCARLADGDPGGSAILAGIQLSTVRRRQPGLPAVSNPHSADHAGRLAAHWENHGGDDREDARVGLRLRGSRRGRNGRALDHRRIVGSYSGLVVARTAALRLFDRPLHRLGLQQVRCQHRYARLRRAAIGNQITNVILFRLLMVIKVMLYSSFSPGACSGSICHGFNRMIRHYFPESQ
jgi:hypothetical protein